MTSTRTRHRRHYVSPRRSQAQRWCCECHTKPTPTIGNNDGNNGRTDEHRSGIRVLSDQGLRRCGRKTRDAASPFLGKSWNGTPLWGPNVVTSRLGVPCRPPPGVCSSGHRWRKQGLRRGGVHNGAAQVSAKEDPCYEDLTWHRVAFVRRIRYVHGYEVVPVK